MIEMICLQTDNGYEGLYVDKELVEEGNPLNEGIERVRYFISLAKNYGINIEDIKFGYINMNGFLDEYEEFPTELSVENIKNIKWSTL
jgi:hypothetical protein